MTRLVFVLLICCIPVLATAQQGYSRNSDSMIKGEQGQVQQFDSLYYQDLFMKYAWYKPDSALFFAKQELLLAEKLNLPRHQVNALRKYGYLLGLLGDYPQAFEILFKALSMSRSLGDAEVLGITLTAIGETYYYLGDYDLARNYYREEKSLNLSEERLRGGEFNLRMAMAFEKSGDLDSALFYIQNAYTYQLAKYGTIKRSYILQVLGIVHSKLGNYRQATQFLHGAAAMATFYNASKDLIEIANAFTEMYIRTGVRDSAFFYARQALDIANTTKYPLGKQVTYHLLYDFYRKSGKTDSALSYLEKETLLKDSLFNQAKQRQVENLAFQEQMREKELIAQQTRQKNTMRMLFLGGGLLVLLVIAGLLWRNNINRKKAYALLEKQKQETDNQKEKAETALKDLKAAQARLVQSEKMASLGELTAGIAHEIQNPLNFVNNFSELNRELITEMNAELEKGNIKEAQDIANDLNQNLERINQHGQRADAIVKGMLQHSKSSSGDLEDTDVNALVGEWLGLAYQSFKTRNPDFHSENNLDLDKSIGSLGLVSQDISRVLLNLFNNAYSSMSEKKKRDPNFNPSLTITSKKQDDVILLSVKDNGTGVAESIRDKIFQPFFTTKPTGQGTGLGLSIAYDIIKAHGGEMFLNNGSDGAEFIIRFPADT